MTKPRDISVFWCCIMNEMMISEQLQKQLLEILCAFDKLCSEYRIPYSLHGGTLLGAVREHDFIPWDDDADVTMTREHFHRLEEVISRSELRYFIRGNIKKQFCEPGNPNVWVDIFICDYISDNCIQQKIKQNLLTVLDIMYRNQKSMKLSNLKRYSFIKRIGYRTAFAVGHIVPKRWTVKLYTYISEKSFLGNRQKMFRSNDQYGGRRLVFPAEWMDAYERIRFADQSVSIIREWNSLLIQSYGEDYMVPIRQERNIKIHDLIRSEQEINL